MYRSTNFNYFDKTPAALRDVMFFNHIDQEQFQLYGIATNYYMLQLDQANFDAIFRDSLSSKNFDVPIQLYSFFKVDESTKHGMDEVGADQTAEREGIIWFNISDLESKLNRVPILGDVVEDLQLHQKFEIYHISKELHRLGIPLRYALKVRLYQDTK